MKKLLLLLSVLYINAFSQTSNISVVDVSSNINMNPGINVGDSTYLGVQYDHYVQDSFAVYIKPFGSNIKQIIGIYKIYDLNQSLYHYNGNLPAYKLKFSIPNVTSGNYYIGVMGYNNCNIDNSNGMAINPVTINSVAGIEVIYSKENLISTEYFNLLGQPINEPNGITVEVKNYIGGYREVKKIISY